MDIQQLQQRAMEISDKYDKLNAQRGQPVWDDQAVMAGFVGDVGDLIQLVMAKNNLRNRDNIEEGLEKYLSGCLWSIFVLADKLGIDITSVFTQNMESLEQKITQQLQ